MNNKLEITWKEAVHFHAPRALYFVIMLIVVVFAVVVSRIHNSPPSTLIVNNGWNFTSTFAYKFTQKYLDIGTHLCDICLRYTNIVADHSGLAV
jgi:hypothetical protein